MKRFIYSFVLAFAGLTLSLNLLSQSPDATDPGHNRVKDISEFYILAHESNFVFSDCLDYYDSCIEASKAKGNPVVQMQAFINKANYYRFYSKNGLAIKNLEAAQEKVKDNTPPEILNEIDYCYGAIEFIKGDYHGAMYFLDRIFNRLANNTKISPGGKYYQLRGDIFLQENNPDSALNDYLKAYALLRTEYHNENIYYVHYLNKIGQAYNKALNISKSLSILDSTRSLMKRLNISNKALEAAIENTMGNNYLLIGEFTKSRANYFAANAYYRSINRLDAVSYINYNIALTYHMESRYREAIDYYNESLGSVKNSVNTQNYKAIQGIASAYSALKDLDSAYYYHQKALDECKKIYGAHNINTMNRKSIIGSFYLDNNLIDSAYSYLFEAAGFFDDHHIISRHSFLSHLHLAELYRRKGELPHALQTLKKTEKDYVDNKSLFTRKNKYEFLYLQSHILYDSAGRTKNQELALRTIRQAQDALRRSIYVYEKYLNSLDLEKNKLYFSNSNKKLYALMLEILDRKSLIENNPSNLDSMLRYSERYKASVLNNQLNKEKQLSASRGSLAIYRKKQHIRNMIRILETELGSIPAKESMDHDRIMQLNILYDRYDSLSNRHDQMDNRMNDQLTSLAESRSYHTKNLPDETLFIEYFFGDSILYIFQLSDMGIDLSRQKINEHDMERLEVTLHSIKDFNPAKMAANEIKNLKLNLHYLYKKLVLPTQYQDYDKLIIIADELLSLLPFEALIEKEPENSNRFDMAAFLLGRASISYAYSISSFFSIANMQDTITYDPEVLCLAPFVSSKQKRNADPSEEFKELKRSKEELKQIGRYYHSKVLEPNDQGKTYILKDFENSDIIHFATHTIIDTNEIYGSRIIIHPGETGKNEHSLNIAEIYNLDMKAGLAFINGCETGYGKYLNSDGHFSIGRAFYISGCPSVIMNTWKVDDRSSKNISTAFYQKLSQGNSTARALQLAKMSYLEHTYGYENHPHFWSAYLHFGQARKFVNRPDHSTIYASILAGILIFIVIFLFRKRMR